MGGGWSWRSGESRVCLPGRVGAAARSQGPRVRGFRWKEWGEETGGGGSEKSPRGGSWAPEGPGTGGTPARDRCGGRLSHRSYPTPAPQWRRGRLHPLPPAPEPLGASQENGSAKLRAARALFSEGSLAGACTFLFALAKPKVIQFALITTISPELSPDSDRRSL